VQPVPPRIQGPQAGRQFRIGVIGAGKQGIAHCLGMTAIPGVTVAGLTDLNSARLAAAAAALRLPANACFTDATEMVTTLGPLDLVSVATTASGQVALGRALLDAGVLRMIVEKPMGTSVMVGAAFANTCRQLRARVAVNYSRRWAFDYRTIKACIDKGFIGELKTIMIAIGRGELGMHGSHYFDLCRYLLASEPRSVFADLRRPAQPNVRGDEIDDPTGHCLFQFENGSRAYVDFSEDLLRKDPILVLKGTGGCITVDEVRQVWTLHSRSNRTWDFPFAEPLKAATLVSRLAAEMLSDVAPAATPDDGVAALSMMAAAQMSNDSGRSIRFPLSAEDVRLEMRLA
jgi:predicted dehydrogenase